MNDPNKSLDESIEQILTWRATRAGPVGLLERINADIDADIRRQRRGFFRGAPRMGRLALLGVAVAALLAAAVGAWSSGSSKPQLAPASATPASQASTPTLTLVYCQQARPVPFGASTLNLTGAWSDRSDLLYLRQEGNVVWGVAVAALAQPARFDPTNALFTALHGTISGQTIHLDRGEVGMVNPTESRTPAMANGSIDLRIERGSDGNVQLSTTAQTGADQLAGPGFSNPVFIACTPTQE